MEEVAADSRPLKAQLLEIWEEFLGPDLDERDDFFRLGGQSITAVRIAREIDRSLELTVRPAAILRHPSVSALADALEAEAEAERSADGPRRLAAGETAPLTLAQEQIWAMELALPDAAFFTELVRLRLDAPLDRRALCLALAEVARRHDVLRMQVRDGGDGFVASPTDEVELDLLEVDFGPLPAAEIDREADRVSAERRSGGFDLTAEAPFRATVASFGRRCHLLLLELHHIAFDGFSRDLLVREVATLYTAFASGGGLALPPLPMQFGDFARWQLEHYGGEAGEEHLAFWTQRLAGLGPPLQLTAEPTAEERYVSGDIAFKLSPDLAASVRALGGEAGATLFMTLLAGFAACVHRRTGDLDIPVASMVANRGWPATQPLIGLFANIVVTRVEVDPAASFRALLEAVRDAALDGFRNEGMPFETVIAALDRAGVDRRRLLQLGFGLHQPYSPPFAVPGGTMRVLRKEQGDGEGDVNPSTFDLTLEMREVGDGLAGHVQYKEHLFGPEEAGALAGELERTLEAAVARPDLALEELRGEGRPC